MVLEMRNKNGNLFAKYKGAAAECQLVGLHASTKVFKPTTKKFVNDPSTYVVFICIDFCKFTISNDIEIQFEPGDYVKIK